MTFEHHARRQIGRQTDYQLQSFTNGHGIGDASLAVSPLPEYRLQEFAEEELGQREQERKAAIDAALRERDDLLSGLGDDLIEDL